MVIEVKTVVTSGEKVMIGGAQERGFWMLVNLIWVIVNEFVQK